MLRKKLVLSIACCLFVLVTSNVYAITKEKEKLTDRINRCNNYLEEIMKIPETSIPSTLLKSCQGIIIMRQYNAGFIFGAKVGQGIALTRDIKTRKWSAPVFVASAEGSFGLQIGVQASDAIILIMNKYGVESLLFTKFKIGVDASLALGPVGRDTEAKIGPNTAFLVYSKSKGLFGGLTFEGGFISQDDRANKQFYGEKISARKIFENEDDVPDEAKVLIRTLEKYSNF